MIKKLYDMGYEEFAKRDELRRTLSHALTDGLCSNAKKTILCDFSADGRSYTGAQILSTAMALAPRLKELADGPRMGVVIPPSFLGIVCNYACIFAGLKPVNLNFTLGEFAAKSCLETGGIKTSVSARPVLEKVLKANPSFPATERQIDILEVLSEIPREEIAQIADDTMEGAESFCEKYGIKKYGDNNVEATLVFTSGSEGAPKAAILTERNIIANCLQIKASEVFAPDEVLLANLPIFHSFGMLFEVWYLAVHGQETVTLNSPLDIKNNIRAVREKRVTAIIGSPTFLRAYIKHAAPEDMATVRLAIAGAEKTPHGFHELWNGLFNNSFREGYGLTEATPVVGVNLAEKDFGYFSTGSRKGAIGKLFPGMQAAILDPNSLEELGFGEQGLLALRGPNVFAGYLNNPKATASALHGDWLVTGDLSRLDEDGFVYIDGRLSRFSKIGGEMVPHTTVESTLNKAFGLTGTDVPTIAISARTDEGKGEALVLLTTMDINLHDAKEALRRAGISNLWHPKHLVKVDAIPLLPSGKLNLKKLSDLAREHTA